MLYAQEREGLLLNVGIAAEADDNVLRKPNPDQDKAFKVTPEAILLNNFGKHQFLVSYNGEYATYTENSKLNYDNHDARAGLRLAHSTRLSSEFGLSYQDQIEEAGSSNSSTILINSFNKFNRTAGLANITYGTPESTGQAIIGLDYSQQRYTNNLQEFRDVDQSNITGTFYYRIAPKTRILLEASLRDFAYVNTTTIGGITFSNQSSEEYILLSGVEWDLTGKTSGTFKLGYQSRTYEEESFSDIDGLSYSLDMVWSPNTYSQVTIGASRRIEESAQLASGGFVTTDYNIGLNHEIKTRTKISIDYTFGTSDIKSTRKRTDKRHNFKLAVTYDLNSWLDTELYYQYEKRDSDLALFRFKSNLIGISLVTTFN